jgi:hypothetical protein
MRGPVASTVFSNEKDKAPSVEEPAPWASTAISKGLPPQKLTPAVFGVPEYATVKVPLMGIPLGIPSSARALLGARMMLIAVNINRPTEIKSRFFLETRFRNIVISSAKRL